MQIDFTIIFSLIYWHINYFLYSSRLIKYLKLGSINTKEKCSNFFYSFFELAKLKKNVYEIMDC